MLNTPYCQHNSLPSVNKLKPMSPCYLPYLDAFPSVVVPAKKLAKQALKLTLATLTPSVAPPAGSTCSISNTRAYLHTTSVTAEASAVNKYRKPFASPLGLPKPGQRVKPTKITQITYIEPPINRSQRVQFQNKEVKEAKEVTPYQALEGHGCYRHYYNKTKKVKARKEYKKDKLYTRQVERSVFYSNLILDNFLANAYSNIKSYS